MALAGIQENLNHFYASIPAFGKSDIYKEIAYLENITRAAFGSTAIGDNIKAMLPLPLLITQSGDWVNKSRSFIKQEKINWNLDLMAKGAEVVSLTIKVAILAEKIFCTVIFSSFGVAQEVVKDVADLINAGCTIYSTTIEINQIDLSSVEKKAEKTQKEALRAIAISAASLAVLDLVGKAYMQVSGAKYIVLTATTVIQVSKHVMGFNQSVIDEEKKKKVV